MDSYFADIHILFENETLNPMTLLQICCERLKLDLKFEFETRSNNSLPFEVKVIICNEFLASAFGSSKNKAKRKACQNSIIKLIQKNTLYFHYFTKEIKKITGDALHIPDHRNYVNSPKNEIFNNSSCEQDGISLTKELAEFAQKHYKKSISWGEKKLEDGLIEMTCFISKFTGTATGQSRKEAKQIAAEKLLAMLKEEKKKNKDIFISKTNHEDIIQINTRSKKVKKLSKCKSLHDQREGEEKSIDSILEDNSKSSLLENLKIFENNQNGNQNSYKISFLKEAECSLIHQNYSREKFEAEITFPVKILNNVFQEQILNSESQLIIWKMLEFLRLKIALFHNLGLKSILPVGSAFFNILREENPTLDIFALYDNSTNVKEYNKMNILNALNISISLSLLKDQKLEIQTSEFFPRQFLNFTDKGCTLRIILVRENSVKIELYNDLIEISEKIQRSANFQTCSLFLRLWRYNCS